MMTNDNNQYYWFSPEEMSSINERLTSFEERTPTLESILTELKVSDVRAHASNIPMTQLGNALGLKPGSKPLWLSEEEYSFLLRIIS